MELNEEAVKKSLNWLNSLVGNSNDSNIARLTYQLLGILYDTYKKLTGENERLRAIPEQLHKEMSERMLEERKIERKLTVRKMQKRLKEHLEKPEFPWDSFNVAEEVIDQIAKEMLKENEK